MPGGISQLEGLQAVLDQLLNLSMDGGVPEAERTELLQQARALRKVVVSLSAQQFAHQTQQLQAASAKLQAVQATLTEQEQSMANLARLLGDVASLLGSLEALAKGGVT